MWRGTTILFALALLSEVSFFGYGEDFENNDLSLSDSTKDYTAVSVEEYIRRIHSMFNPGCGGRRRRGRSARCASAVVTDELINTKYRMWKRNADLINSILALPKGLNDAGR